MSEAATEKETFETMGGPVSFPISVPQKPKLEAAILEAQKSIKGVGKAAYNEFSKYAYASSDQILAASREALHGAGVSFRMSGFNIEDRAGLKWVVCQFALTHVESMEALKAAYGWPLIQSGDKPKPLDKVLGGALTTATRYYLRGLLSIPQVDGGEEMAARNDEPGPQERRPTPDQWHLIKSLIAETNTNPDALEADFGPGESLTFEMANRVIDYLKSLKGKAGTNGK